MNKWKVGDTCLTYDLTMETVVVAIEGESVTVRDPGKHKDIKSFHISKLRLPSYLTTSTDRS